MILLSASFSTNPQYFINLNDPDPYDDETHCPVIISVAQKQTKRKSEHAIGFKIFQCELTDKKLDQRFFNTNTSVRNDNFKYVPMEPIKICIQRQY